MVIVFLGLDSLWYYFNETPYKKLLDKDDLLIRSELHERLLESLPASYVQLYAAIYIVKFNQGNNDKYFRISLYLSLIGIL